ncbi:ABC transporter type 1, transmembrane domain-containing protein [Nemania abortiva]|nr:ABC transporter type 1, transmembrane domain-containing protein [Nemania abortiva]
MACSADNDFGPTLPLVGGECRVFDFTLLFEHLFFTLIPSVIVTLLAAVRAWRCRGRRKIVSWPLQRALKRVVLLLLSAFQIVQIVILARESRGDSRFYSALGIPASSLNFVALLSLVALSCIRIRCSLPKEFMANHDLFTLWLKFWVQQYNLEPYPNLGYWAGIYALLGVLTVLSIAAETGYFFLQILPLSALGIHKRLLVILRAPMSFFANHDTGTILNLFTSDLNLMDLPLSLSFLMTCEKIAATFAELVLTSIASGYLAAVIPAIAVTVYFVQRVYGRTSRQLRVLDLAAKAPLFSHFVESFDGRVTIRSFAWTEEAERQNMGYLDASQRPHYLLFCLQRWLTLVLDLIAAGLATLLVAIAVALRHTIDPTSLGVGLVSVIGFGQVLTQLVTNWSNLDTSLGAVSRIKKYVTETPVEEPSGYYGLEIPASWPSRGQIVLKNASCSYGVTRVLQDINLRFEPGTKTAICGRTGSGKSSLLGMIVRLVEVDDGSVEIDDMNISQVTLDRLRTAIIAVPQDALFMIGSVRFNLNPYEDVNLDDDVLLSILKDTGLEKLIADNGGLEAEMHPEWFSTGQAQLFCLARAMLRAKGKSAVPYGFPLPL